MNPGASDLRRQHGIDAEWRAAAYLEARGLRLLARNMSCRRGELDLVCLHGEVLVIVEVRQRARAAFGGALASVTRRKQLRLIRATQYFLGHRADWRGRDIRFDVVAVNGPLAGRPDIVWIQDAFRTT